jgi:hypothetical protein
MYQNSIHQLVTMILNKRRSGMTVSIALGDGIVRSFGGHYMCVQRNQTVQRFCVPRPKENNIVPYLKRKDSQ